MNQNAPTAPVTPDKAVPGMVPPPIDGKQNPGIPDNVIPPRPPAPAKEPEKQDPPPPADKPKVPEDKPKTPEDKAKAAEDKAKAAEDKAKTPEPPTPSNGKKPEVKDKPPDPKKSNTRKKAGAKTPEKPKKEAETDSKKPPAQEKQAQPEAETPVPSAEPIAAPRHGEEEKIVYLNLSDLHPFKDHPFQVRKDNEMQAMVESVKDKGVTQPAIVRPREGGGYEIVSGHRRQQASELAGFFEMPCIVRNLTDEQAITQMVEDNTNQREMILPSERAKALKMQLEAIKKQGVRSEDGKGERSNEVVAERNNLTAKVVQRYIKLTELVPDLMELADNTVKHAGDKKILKLGFMSAYELAFIRPKLQKDIAVAIEGEQAVPNQSQIRKMRELDKEKRLTPDIIDGIMQEDKKKEVDRVIISSQELEKYFGKDKTPREMKDTILKLLEEYKEKHPPELGKETQERGK